VDEARSFQAESLLDTRPVPLERLVGSHIGTAQKRSGVALHEAEIRTDVDRNLPAVVLPVKADGHRPGGLAHHAGLFAQDESELGSQ